jgi:hypothetical protein
MKYPIWYTERGMTGGIIGWQRWFIIAIKPSHKGDVGLVQHELTHVKQWAALTLATGVVLGLIYMPLILCAPSIHAALYRFVRRYRGWCEAQAFGQQTKFYPDDRAVKFAGYLSRNYNLDITFAAALEHIQKSR